jgi:hypothetical protein
LRRFLADNNLTDRNHQKNLAELKRNDQFGVIEKFLSDRDWVTERVSEGWSSRNFAEHLGCSQNFVCTFLRTTGHPLERGSFSFWERELTSFIQNLDEQTVNNSRKIIDPKEIDIFVPSVNLAIEVNGVYWHREERVGKNYHIDKTRSCNDKNIRLIHFFEHQLESKPGICKSIIRHGLGKSVKKQARKCEVVSLTSKQYMDFCNDNHLQGGVNASVRYGLMENGQLVAVIGFGKSRYDKKYQCELLRYCCLLNHHVIGGASKLFSHFIKTNNPSSIMSYCNNTSFEGSMYEAIGMTYVRQTPPNYIWASATGQQISRYQTQAHKIGGAEKETMQSKGFFKVYDCGQKVYEWLNT